MTNISVNFTATTGKIKPMHAVNNGPIRYEVEQIRENFTTFQAAEIPYVRTHNASFCNEYGGEHIVDMQAIFPDFSKEVDDESAYDFTLTDLYLQNMLDCSRNAVMKPEQVKKFVGI